MNDPRPASFGSMFLMVGGGMAVIYGLLGAFSAISGVKLEFGSTGARGVPLTSSWTGVALLLASGVGLFLLGRRWDAPRFSELRRRRPWLVPVVVTFVVIPALVMVLFAMLQ